MSQKTLSAALQGLQSHDITSKVCVARDHILDETSRDVVYAGVLRVEGDSVAAPHIFHGHNVSIRVIRCVERGRAQAEQLISKEVELLSMIQSEHVCVLYGLTYSVPGCPGIPGIVTESIGYEMMEFLVSNPNAHLRIIKEIAQGLSYLHSQKIIYANLSPTSLRISTKGTVKLTDFKLSRVNEGKCFDEKGYFPYRNPRYTPPELIPMTQTQVLDMILTFASDVWSFGMVALQIVERCHSNLSAKENSDCIPFNHIQPYNNTLAARTNLDRRLIQAIHEGDLPRRQLYSQAIPAWLWGLMHCCWNLNPANRSTIHVVLVAICGHL